MAYGRTILGENTAPSTLASSIMQAIGEQSQRQDFCDLTIVVEGVEFRSHRFILSAVSGFFRGLLTSGMIEDVQRRTYLNGVSLETFTLLIDCIFKGNDILTDDNVIDVWHAANLLDIPFLFTHCEGFIIDHLTGHNCIDVYQNAKLIDSSRIMQLAWDIIVHDFNSIQCSHDILSLSLDDMKNLVKSHNLKTMSEDDVVDLIMRWVSCTVPVRKCQSLEKISFQDNHLTVSDMNSKENEHTEKVTSSSRLTSGSTNKNGICDCSGDDTDLRLNEEENEVQIVSEKENHIRKTTIHKQDHSREVHVVELLKCARYCFVSGWTLQELLSNKLILENEGAVSLIKRSIHYQVEPSRRHDYLPKAATYRNYSELENVIIWTTEELDTHRNEVTFLNSMSVVNNRLTKLSFGEKIENCQFAVSGNNIFVADNKKCRRFYCLDTNVDQLSWFYPRSGHTVVAVGDCIYVVGGCQKHIQRLNVNRSNMTEIVGSIPVAVSCTKAGVVRKNIIVLGRAEDKAEVTVVQGFNTQTMTSLRVSDIHISPQNMVVFHKDDWLFVVFGNGAVRKLEESGPGVISIRFIKHLWDFERKLNGCVLVGEQLYLFEDVRPQNIGAVSNILLPGVFTSIRNICQPGRGFHAAVMQKEQTVFSAISKSVRNYF